MLRHSCGFPAASLRDVAGKFFLAYQASTLIFGLFLRFLRKRHAEPGGGAPRAGGCASGVRRRSQPVGLVGRGTDAHGGVVLFHTLLSVVGALYYYL